MLFVQTTCGIKNKKEACPLDTELKETETKKMLIACKRTIES
jgi:hypothetical protein